MRDYMYIESWKSDQRKAFKQPDPEGKSKGRKEGGQDDYAGGKLSVAAHVFRHDIAAGGRGTGEHDHDRDHLFVSEAAQPRQRKENSRDQEQLGESADDTQTQAFQRAGEFKGSADYDERERGRHRGEVVDRLADDGGEGDAG